MIIGYTSTVFKYVYIGTWDCCECTMTRQPRCVFIRWTAHETNALRGNQLLLLLRKISARRGCWIDLGYAFACECVCVLSRPFYSPHPLVQSYLKLNIMVKRFVALNRDTEDGNRVHTHTQNDIVRYPLYLCHLILMYSILEADTQWHHLSSSRRRTLFSRWASGRSSPPTPPFYKHAFAQHGCSWDIVYRINRWQHYK